MPTTDSRDGDRLDLTTLGLRLLGGPSALPKGHPMSALAVQIAMTVPLGVLVVIVLSRDDPSLFFPGVGAAWGTGVLLVVVGLLLPRTPVSGHRAPAEEPPDPR